MEGTSKRDPSYEVKRDGISKIQPLTRFSFHCQAKILIKIHQKVPFIETTEARHDTQTVSFHSYFPHQYDTLHFYNNLLVPRKPSKLLRYSNSTVWPNGINGTCELPIHWMWTSTSKQKWLCTYKYINLYFQLLSSYSYHYCSDIISYFVFILFYRLHSP